MIGKTRHHDIAVVGAGPAGSYCATALAARGYQVLLLERSQQARQQIICTGIVSAEAFLRFCLPFSAVLCPLKKASLISPAGNKLEYRAAVPFAYVVDRPHFDAALQGRAASLGVDVCYGFHAEGVEWMSTGLRIQGRLQEEPYSVQAQAAVFATGFNRGLARRLGLGRQTSCIQGVQAEAPFDQLEATEVYFGRRVAPGFFAWVVPMRCGFARIGLLARRNGRQKFHQFLRGPELRDRLRQYPANVTSRCIVQGIAPRTAGNRFVVVGEAAGQVKTSTSGGIYYGLLGAELAAEVIDEGFRRGDLSEKQLWRYHQRWVSLLGPELRAGLKLQSLGAVMTDAEIDHLFRLLGGNGLLAELLQRLRFDWHNSLIQFLLEHESLTDFLELLWRRYSPGRAFPLAT